MPELDLTPSERAAIRPRKRFRARPFFRLACVLLVAAMIPLPWSIRSGCDASLHYQTVTKTGHGILGGNTGSLLITLAVLGLAIAAPFLALCVDRVTRLIVDLACFIGLFFFSGFVALMIAGPERTWLPAGQAALATVLVMTVDALVALLKDTRADPPAPAPDDTG
jgi:hypothetical protein